MKRYIVFLAALFFAPLAFAQDPATGFPPYGSFADGRFDALDRQNLNVNFAIPIVSSPGRGLDLRFAIIYDSLIWKKVQTGTSTYAWTPKAGPDGTATWGWKKDSVVGIISYTTFTRRCLVDSSLPRVFITDTGYTYTYTDPAGTAHSFPGVHPSNNDCIADVRTGYAADGSGLYIDATNAPAAVVYGSTGMKVSSAGTLTDTNGNLISNTVVSSTETDWQDSAGHTALKIAKNTNSILYQYPDTTGTYQTITMTLQSFSVQTNFACSNVVEYTGTANLPTSISFPNGQSYSFTYEQTPNTPGYYTARVQRVTLPTGGYYEYDYPSTGNNGINCSDATVASLTRAINDGAASATWQYSRSQTGTSTWATTVTAPQLPYDTAANQSVFTFTNGAETSRQIYQGSAAPSNLLRTVNTTWAGGTPSSQTVILEDNQTQSQTRTSFDSFGNLLSLSEYDWGTGAPGALLRQITHTFLATSAYTAVNIRNRLAQQLIKDGSGAVKARVNIVYDESGYINASCPANVTQHDDANYGCTFTTRGNPTTTTVYTDPVTPAGGIAKHTYYDSLGNAVRADVNCCQQEQWVYSAATNYTFPDSVVRGPTGSQLTISGAYNAYTGLVASTTDENNQPTAYSYDSMKRLTNVTRPDNAQITYSYTDALPPAQSSATVGVPVQGTNKRQQTTAVDGLARSVKVTILDASQSSYSILETQYDPVGRPYRRYNPHNSTRQYYTESRFDALGRPVKTILQDNSQTNFSYATTTVTVTDPTGKQRKSQADGLGRLVSVYEPDVNNGNALTQQTSYAYTVFDTLATVSQGAQTRTYNYDALGRLTSAATPEAGTVNFQYDPVFYTLVTQRTDARGVITNYNFDTLNRLTQVSYNVGTTGVPATPTVTFTYGTNQAQNNNGRMLTMTDAVGSETYAYDPNLPRITQVQKLISGTAYTIGYQYNLAGEVTQISYPSGRSVQPSYDAIGRLTTVASGGTNFASGFGYNPAWEVTAFNYGNGVAASFSYSADRLQLTALSHAKGASTLFSMNYGYGAAGSNNAQIASTSDNVDAGRTVNYT